MAAADLDALLHSMRLGNPSSSRQLPQYRAPPPPPPHVRADRVAVAAASTSSVRAVCDARRAAAAVPAADARADRDARHADAAAAAGAAPCGAAELWRDRELHGSHPSPAQSSSAPSTSASQRLPQPGAAAASTARYLVEPRAGDWRRSGAGRGSGSPPLHQAGACDVEGVGGARGPAARGGGDRERLDALAAVMGSSEGDVVFLALLRACVGRDDELEGIINAACNGKGFLMCVAQQEPRQRFKMGEFFLGKNDSVTRQHKILREIVEKLLKNSGFVVFTLNQ
ncbi:hypothetical protein ACP4OV_015302 [Aristida adscensionis]